MPTRHSRSLSPRAYLAYLDGRYDDALDLTEQAASAGIGTTDWARGHLAQEWRCETRTVRGPGG